MTKNLCDKVSKIKILNWQFCCIFHWLRCGILHLFCRCCFHVEICDTKLPFLRFFKNAEISQNVGLFFYFFGTPCLQFYWILSLQYQFVTRRKNPMQFRFKMSAWEVRQCERFGDIRLIGMYVLVSFSHMYICLKQNGKLKS